MTPKIGTIGEATVLLADGYTHTTIKGRTVAALHDPQSNEQRALAKDLDLNTKAMNRGHDIVHSLLAHWVGLPHSPALAVAAGVFPGNGGHPEQTAREEAAVLAIQKWLASLGTDPVSLVSWRNLE